MPVGSVVYLAEFEDQGSDTVVGGVAPGGAKLVGAAGIGGVTGGGGGVTGTTGGTIGVLGVLKTTGDAGGADGADGASAAKLLVRKVSLLPRAFNACVVGCDKPPAAGSISRPQAPHLCTEST